MRDFLGIEPIWISSLLEKTVKGKHKKKYINAIIGKIMNGSVPVTGALAHLFPINIKSWKPIIYARDEPLMICTINPTVGASEIRND